MTYMKAVIFKNERSDGKKKWTRMVIVDLGTDLSNVKNDREIWERVKWLMAGNDLPCLEGLDGHPDSQYGRTDVRVIPVLVMDNGDVFQLTPLDIKE